MAPFARDYWVALVLLFFYGKRNERGLTGLCCGRFRNEGTSRRCNFGSWNKGQCLHGSLFQSDAGVCNNVWYLRSREGTCEAGSTLPVAYVGQLLSRCRRGRVWEQCSTEQRSIVCIDLNKNNLMQYEPPLQTTFGIDTKTTHMCTFCHWINAFSGFRNFQRHETSGFLVEEYRKIKNPTQHSNKRYKYWHENL